MRPFRVSIAVLCALTAGCAQPDRGGDMFGPGDGGDDGTNDGGTGDGETAPGDDGGDGTGGGDDSGDDGGDGGVKLDVSGDDGPPTGCDPDSEDCGCSAVDLLFVIDNSASMEDDQLRLINSFPGFVAGIEQSVQAGGDLHIGVTTTDIGYTQPGYDPACVGLGVMVEHSVAGACGPYATGQHWFSEDDDIQAKFECAAHLGSAGDNTERPVASAEQALSDAFNDPGGCNDGFLRDDALLVVVVITDEDDYTSPGTAAERHQAFLSLKNDQEDNIVWLGILKSPGHPPECDPNLNGPANRLVELTNLFENGFVGDICQNDFSPFFADAVGLIGEAFGDCKPIPPEG